MPSSRRRKRQRSSSVRSTANKKAAAADLFVPLPAASSSSSNNQQQHQLASRLQRRLCDELGYRKIAFTHTVYGRPTAAQDRVDTALPRSLLATNNTNIPPPTILRRLHLVVEQRADVLACLMSSSSSATAVVDPLIREMHSILQEYDLVSLQPRNDACWQAVCDAARTSPTSAAGFMLDIVTLDPSLPMRATDVQALLGTAALALELPYAAAVLHNSGKERRNLVQTCRALQLATMSCRKHNPSKILVSSGPRSTNNQDDAGPLALRSAGDVANLLHVVGGLEARTAAAATTGAGVLDFRRRRQRCGDGDEIALMCVEVEVVNEEELRTAGKTQKAQRTKKSTPAPSLREVESSQGTGDHNGNSSSASAAGNNDDDDDDDREHINKKQHDEPDDGGGGDDGFIAF